MTVRPRVRLADLAVHLAFCLLAFAYFAASAALSQPFDPLTLTGGISLLALALALPFASVIRSSRHHTWAVYLDLYAVAVPGAGLLRAITFPPRPFQLAEVLPLLALLIALMVTALIGALVIEYRIHGIWPQRDFLTRRLV